MYPFILILFGIIFATQNLVAQAPNPQPGGNADETLARIEAAIRSGDAINLSNYFNQSIEVTTDEKDEVYSKNQAQFVIKDFFIKYPIKSFNILHKGNSNQTYYAVGMYVSNRGSFDANLFLKKNGSSFLIDQIRFEKDK